MINIELENLYYAYHRFRLRANNESGIILGLYDVFPTNSYYREIFLDCKITSFESGRGIPRKLIEVLQETLSEYAKLNHVTYIHNVSIKKENLEAIKKLPKLYLDNGYKFEEDKGFLVYVKKFK
ncbi:MAG: hypothetical protein ACMXX7_01645 [Candidatus Woesearchaeota archaeon]